MSEDNGVIASLAPATPAGRQNYDHEQPSPARWFTSPGARDTPVRDGARLAAPARPIRARGRCEHTGRHVPPVPLKV